MLGAHRERAAATEPEGSGPRGVRRWPITGVERAWLVTQGYVDLFVAMLPRDGSSGRRQHLLRAESGSLVFGLPASDDVAFEAVGTTATILESVTREELDARLRRAESATDARRALEQWIDRLCECLAAGVAPRGCVSYGAGEKATVAAGGCMRPIAGPVGVELVTGEAALYGHAPAAVRRGDLIALSWHAWMTMPAASTVHLTALRDLIERGSVWIALDTLHGLAVEAARNHIARTRTSERERQVSKIESATTARVKAFASLAATFHGRSSDAVELPGRMTQASPHEALIASCRLVAAQMRLPFTSPSGPAYRSVKEAVDSIARASRFRVRQVALTDIWWRHDQGPLLGFLKEGNRPVALLPRSPSYYELVDPQDDRPRTVNGALAAHLSSTAYTFYRPFAPVPIGIAQLAHFGVSGCGREIVTVVTTGAIAGMIATAIPISTGVLINSIIPSTDRTQLAQWMLMLLVCTAASAMFQVARTIALLRLEVKLAHSIQAAVWDRLISLPSRFFREYSAGDLASRAMGIDAVRQTLSGATIRAILSGVFSVFSFALLFYYDLRLALCAIALIAVALTLFATLAYLQRVQQREVVSIQAKTSGVVLQILTGIRKLRVAGAELRAFAIWADLFSRQRRAQFRIRGLSNAFRTFYVSFPLVSFAALFSLVLFGYDSTSLKTGDFLAFLAAFTGCIDATLATASAAISALSVIPQYEIARPILQALPEVSPGQVDPGPLTGDINFDRVVFRYRADGALVLNGLSFRVKAGEFVAFVGPSGSGKSTILRLLLGFETAESGAIYYDGRDFKALDTRAVRRQIGVVLQSGRLMPGDVYTNIVGCSSATLEEAWAASRMAGLDEDIKRMPMGMQTMVTDGGSTLSGGQRQRLMIARAIVTSPRMLFFDEATSALDNRTQSIVSESLERLRATRLVIAHRLSTVINADRIFVVEKGRVVQSGAYAELVAAPGLFQELASRQLA